MSAQGVKIKGVLALSSIEVWERMSFYTMQAILVLYASATTLKGGLGWTESDALRLTGLYGALVYCSPIIGGYLADKFIGHKRSTLIGAVIMMFGHGSLAISGQFAFFVGITLLIIGSGFLKPAISAMVGEFYPRTEETNKQSAFAIFYMAINIGSLLGTLIAGPISSTYGYNYAFGFAAFGLVVAIINILVTKNKSLRNVGNLTKKDINEIKKPWSKNEYIKFWTFITLCVSNIFWNIFYALPYGLLTLYADKNIDKSLFGWTIPTTWYYAMYGGFIIIFAPIMAGIYKFIAHETKWNFTLSYKLAVGYLLLAIASLFILPLVKNIAVDHNYVGSSVYLIMFYLFFAISELITVPVLLSAATTFAAPGWSSRLVSLNMLISWSIGAWLGGEFGALAQNVSPFSMFKFVIIICAIFFIGHLLSNKKIEHIIKLEH